MLLPDEIEGMDGGVTPVHNQEEIVRLLFHPQMVDSSGKLEEVCFPTDELIERRGKSLSVVRATLLADREGELLSRSKRMEKPDRGRSSFGYLAAVCIDIRSITKGESLRVFKVVPDPILVDGERDVFHAKIAKASPEFTRGFVRGFRDKLVSAFSGPVRL